MDQGNSEKKRLVFLSYIVDWCAVMILYCYGELYIFWLCKSINDILYA